MEAGCFPAIGNFAGKRKRKKRVGGRGDGSWVVWWSGLLVRRGKRGGCGIGRLPVVILFPVVGRSGRRKKKRERGQAAAVCGAAASGDERERGMRYGRPERGKREEGSGVRWGFAGAAERRRRRVSTVGRR
ncbi:hypothetical protein HAX54_009064 [Datura stramonium]|uniref:Uncharacterized protein n=1 Tax=Datura stramonium TaxID=4076 RepID=A0ABS8TEE9_DATST|nr:hypothetical protein [Datura stramonium]